MFETNSYLHKQSLDLVSGDYAYYFRCIDAGGNTAEANTGFKVFVDKTEPRVTRAYKETDALKIVTDEDAQCVYSLSSCNYQFSDGKLFIYSNTDNLRNHYAEWKPTSTYFIKCKDKYENQPSPNQCSLIASAVKLN